MIAADLFSGIADVIFPPLCLSCKRLLRTHDEKIFCATCRDSLSFLSQSHCPVCGVVFPDSPAGHHLCGDCATHPPHYDLARAAVLYDGMMSDMIHRFKYGRDLICGRALGRLLADFEFDDVDWGAFDLILPVPLHIRRLRQRGFNQSLLIARQLGKKHGLNVNFSLLKRHRFTLTQTGLHKKERENNMQNAFDVLSPHKIEGRNIMIIDDVYTTGATVNACAKALKKAGARQVAAITLARVL